jgi:hypothetical protein
MPSADLSATTDVLPRRAAGAPAEHDGPVHVVLGPRTRLGATLLEQVGQAGGSAVAIARHDRDGAALASGPGEVLTIGADDATMAAAWGDRPLRVHVCALGPVQSGDGVDVAAVERDLAFVERILATAGDRPVQVVLVSTVIVLAPGTDRRFYGGWKGLVEERLRSLVASRPQAGFVVLHPGRLVGPDDAGRLGRFVHTTYGGLARRMLSPTTTTQRARLVGVDARLWLLTRTASLLVQVVTGRVPAGGSPRPQSEFSREG